MRVGVFVDAYNLYYGARSICGKNAPGWRWLDLGALVMPRLHGWPGGQVSEIHYCTARRVRAGIVSSSDQESYLQALRSHDPLVAIHFGKYVERPKRGVLAVPHKTRPIPWPAAGPPSWLPARQVPGPQGEKEMLVSIRSFEEKGSDVNVATELLWACLRGSVDAAVVISNDSDLTSPLQRARHVVPVGLLNPGSRPLARDLMGSPDTGAGRHWWGRLTMEEYLAAQMPETVGDQHRPAGW